MIDATFVKALNDMAPGGNLTVEGITYTSKQYFNLPLPEEPTVRPLEIPTLTGLVDFVKSVVTESDDLYKLNIIVDSPTTVRVVSDPFGVKKQRDCYLIADCGAAPFRFGQWYNITEGIIALQTMFEGSDDRAALLLALGTLKDEAVNTSMDDGVSQTATFSSGITLVESRKIPNPVSLYPYRTFREISQPASPFVVRLQKGKEGMQVALFEADGGTWRLEARTSIRDYITELLDTEIPIIA